MIKDKDCLVDERDNIPESRVFKHKGYVLQQSSYNNHFMIFKDDKMVMHCQCIKKLNQKKAEKEIDSYIARLCQKAQEENK